MQITTVGLNLAKSVSQVHAINTAGEVVAGDAPGRVAVVAARLDGGR
jgi:hypothetical protein